MKISMSKNRADFGFPSRQESWDVDFPINLLNYSKNIITKQVDEVEKTKLPKLSKREMEILDLICKGNSNDEIAEALFISKRTVENHKANLIQKTDTGNTVNLVIYAFKNKIIEL